MPRWHEFTKGQLKQTDPGSRLIAALHSLHNVTVTVSLFQYG